MEGLKELCFVLENHVLWAWSAIMALPWIFVSKNTNYKHQITNKSQISIFNDQNLPGQDIVWIFEFWSLEFV